MHNKDKSIWKDRLYIYGLIGVSIGLLLCLTMILGFPSSSQPIQTANNPAMLWDTLTAQALTFVEGKKSSSGFIKGRDLIQVQQSQVIPLSINQTQDTLTIAAKRNPISLPYKTSSISNTSQVAYYQVEGKDVQTLNDLLQEHFNQIILPSNKRFSELFAESQPDFKIETKKEQKLHLFLNQLGLADELTLFDLLNAREKPTFQEVILNALIYSAKSSNNHSYLKGSQIVLSPQAKELSAYNELLVSHLGPNQPGELLASPRQILSETSVWQNWVFPLLTGFMMLCFGLILWNRSKSLEENEQEESEGIGIFGNNGSDQSTGIGKKLGDSARILIHEIESAKDAEEFSEIISQNSHTEKEEIKRIKTAVHTKIKALTPLLKHAVNPARVTSYENGSGSLAISSNGLKEASSHESQLLGQVVDKIQEALKSFEPLAQEIQEHTKDQSMNQAAFKDLLLIKNKEQQESFRYQQESLENISRYLQKLLHENSQTQELKGNSELHVLSDEFFQLSAAVKEQNAEFKDLVKTHLQKQEDLFNTQINEERQKLLSLKSQHSQLQQSHEDLLKQTESLEKKAAIQVDTLEKLQVYIQKLWGIVSRKDPQNILPGLTELFHDSPSFIKASDKELEKIRQNLSLLAKPHEIFLQELRMGNDIRKVITHFVGYMDNYHQVGLAPEWKKLSEKLTLYESFDQHLEGDAHAALGKLIDICTHIEHSDDLPEKLRRLLAIFHFDIKTKKDIQKHLNNAQVIELYTSPSKTSLHTLSNSLKQEQDIRVAFIALVDQILEMITKLSIYEEAGLKRLNFRAEVIQPLLRSLIYQNIRIAISKSGGESLEELDKVLYEFIPSLNNEKALSAYKISTADKSKFGQMIDIYKQVVQSKGQNDLDADYIKNLFKRHGQMVKKLDRLDPNTVAPEDRAAFFTDLFHLGLHACDYLRFRSLPSIEIHEERINVSMVRNQMEIEDLDPKSYKVFSYAPDISQSSKVIRKLAREVGVKSLDEVLVSGVFMGPEAFK